MVNNKEIGPLDEVDGGIEAVQQDITDKEQAKQEKQERILNELTREIANMVEGNRALYQADKKSGRRGEPRGYWEISSRLETEINKFKQKINNDEERVRRAEQQLEELSGKVQSGDVSEEQLFDLKFKLGQAKQRLEADKQRLPNMEKELDEVKSQQFENVKEQESIAGEGLFNYDPKASVEFAVDNVITHHQGGTDPASKSEDYSIHRDELLNNRVPAELTKREKERRLLKEQEKDNQLKLEHDKMFKRLEQKFEDLKREIEKDISTAEGQIDALTASTEEGKAAIEKFLNARYMRKGKKESDRQSAAQQLEKMVTERDDFVQLIMKIDNKAKGFRNAQTSEYYPDAILPKIYPLYHSGEMSDQVKALKEKMFKEIDSFKEQVIRRTDGILKRVTFIGREEAEKIDHKIRFK